jgi:NAD/NADP transhydrogenase alpha subunit
MHMKRITAIAVVLGLAAAPAFAEPVKMTEAQLDQVTAGQSLIDISVQNVGNASVTVNPNVSANAPVTVSISVLGTGAR